MMRQLPPGPRFAPLQTVLYMRDPDGYLAACQRRYGDPFFVPTLAGPSVVTGNPETVRTILSAPSETFASAARFLQPLVGENSVVVTGGSRHNQQRKALMPLMHGDRMRAYGRSMQSISHANLSGWPAGRPFRLLEQMHEITLQIMIRSILGVTEGERAARLRAATIEKFEAFKPYLVLFDALRHEFGGFGPWARFQRASRRMDTLLNEEMDRRRTGRFIGDDVLSMLLMAGHGADARIDDVELRENLMTLLVAGYETTATSLSWAFYHLHRDTDKLERARAEIEALGPDPEPDAVERLPYLTAICNESLRMNSPVPQFSRLVVRDFELAGYRLRPGTIVSGSTSLVHASDALYPDPSAFSPERFMRRSYAHHEFLPFGVGARRCLGASFALYEMKQVLAAILPACRLRLAGERPERSVMHGATMGPEHGVTVVLMERRKRATAAS